MRLLNENEIDITGFASVRERVLLQSRAFFKHQPEEKSFGQFGSLLYLANAWFTPKGATGMHHHHEGVDIVSLIPRGEMQHQGTIGDGERVLGGQVQIQRSGQQGFSHNEINPATEPQPFIQMWLQPEHIAEQASFELMDIQPKGETLIYQSFDTQLSVLNLQGSDSWQAAEKSLIYIYAGSGWLHGASEKIRLERGMLVQIDSPKIENDNQLAFLCCRLLARKRTNKS